jgi:hypothetical protein
MSRADDIYIAGFNAALDIARAAAAGIAACPMRTLRRELAAGALQAFAEEAAQAVFLGEQLLVTAAPAPPQPPTTRAPDATKCDTCAPTTGCS